MFKIEKESEEACLNSAGKVPIISPAKAILHHISYRENKYSIILPNNITPTKVPKPIGSKNERLVFISLKKL